MDPLKYLEKKPALAAKLEKVLRWEPSLERLLKKLPAIKKEFAKQSAMVQREVEKNLKIEGQVYASLPENGLSSRTILSAMKKRALIETPRWKEGYVSGAVYHGAEDHIKFLNQIYALHSQTNPLHVDLWPSITRYENEIVSMAAGLMSQSMSGADVTGSVSSGGTESILLAMKAYRDHARMERSIRRPEMVVPETAHAAFDKAADYFGIKKRIIPVDKNFQADLKAVARAINSKTIVVVGSAPSFPHGIIDPVMQMSELARMAGAGFHTDSCLGGFVLPFARDLGVPVPEFDFRLPGVTSISLDTHKFGYAAKGTSVILYRNPDLRKYQFYTTADWPGGLYFSPTFAGSRPGALIAQCHAALLKTGQRGYRDATAKIIDTAAKIKAGIAAIPGLHVLGDPLWVIAFASDSLNIYNIAERMTARGWNLNGLHRPACLHICVTLRHTRKGVGERFLKDLRSCIALEKKNPGAVSGMAPVYGMAATLPARGMVRDLLAVVLDRIYRL